MFTATAADRTSRSKARSLVVEASFECAVVQTWLSLTWGGWRCLLGKDLAQLCSVTDVLCGFGSHADLSVFGFCRGLRTVSSGGFREILRK